MNGANDPNRLLNETRSIDQAISDVERDLEQLKSVQSRAARDPDTSARSPLQREVDRLSEEIIQRYTALTARVKKLKSDPESGSLRNAPQVGKADRRLKGMINKYQQQESQYRKELQERNAREYRIVRPDASDAEVREATEDSNQQVFSQAVSTESRCRSICFLMLFYQLINSDRRGQAQSIANSVRGRHDQIQKIERDMITLAQLFQDLEAAVVQQEPAVMQIEQQGNEVNDNVKVANTQLDSAVKKARAARRKKWWCAGIVALIIIIIVVVVVVVVEVVKKN